MRRYLGLRGGLTDSACHSSSTGASFSCVMLTTGLRGGYCQYRLREEEVGVQRVKVTCLMSHS